MTASRAYGSPKDCEISRFMRLARAGEAPAVEIAIASGPLRTIAGRMKLQSGGTSTTLTSIVRRSAPSQTAMLTSVSLVAAIARKVLSRSPSWKVRCSQVIDPSAAYFASSEPTRGATTRTSPSQSSRPSTFSRPTSPPPTTRQRRPLSLIAVI